MKKLVTQKLTDEDRRVVVQKLCQSIRNLLSAQSIQRAALFLIEVGSHVGLAEKVTSTCGAHTVEGQYSCDLPIGHPQHDRHRQVKARGCSEFDWEELT